MENEMSRDVNKMRAKREQDKPKSKPVMSYINFNTTEEFEDWQKAEVRQIQSVSPAPAKFNAASGSSINEQLIASGSISFGVFVLYWKDKIQATVY
jgi:hypothetical protein